MVLLSKRKRETREVMQAKYEAKINKGKSLAGDRLGHWLLNDGW